MKQYAGFAFSNFYPAGGFRDFVGFFDTPEEAKAAVEVATKGKNDFFDARGHVANLADGPNGSILCAYYGDYGWEFETEPT